MTVTTTSNKDRFLGNSATTVFAYTFIIAAADQLAVIIADPNDIATTLILDTHYTVSGVGQSEGGAVTTLDLSSITGETFPELPTGWSITIAREVPLTQLTDLITQGKYSAETFEAAFDFAMFVAQQLQEELSRAFKVTITSGLSGDDLIDQINAAIAAAAASAAAAAASATAALVSENNAATSETNAAASAAAAAIGTFTKNDDGAATQVLKSTRTSASPVDDDSAFFSHLANNDSAAAIEYARETVTQKDVTDGSEKGEYEIGVANGSGVIEGIGRFEFNAFRFLKAANYQRVLKTATYTAAKETFIDADASGGDFSVNLPTAVGISGRIYAIKGAGASGKVTVDPNGSETIDGKTTLDVYSNGLLFIYSDNVNWRVINYDSGWSTWVPTFGAGGSMTWTSITTHTARFKQIGVNTVSFEIRATGTTAGTADEDLTFTLPVAPANTNVGFAGVAELGGTSFNSGFGRHSSGSTVEVSPFNNGPWTLGANIGFSLIGTYEN